MGEQLENKFTWVIENFSGLKDECYSDQFVVGGCKWRVGAFPKGNGVDYLSLYLYVVEFDSLPPGWKRLTHLRFRVVNRFSKEPSESIVKETWHWFDARSRSWGFASVISFNELFHRVNGYLLNNELIVEVEVDVLKVIGKLDVSEKSKEAAKPLSKAVGTLAADAPAFGSRGDSRYQQEQKTMDASKDDSDDDAYEEDSDDEAFEENSVHDTLFAVSKVGAGDLSSLNPSDPLKKAPETVTHGVAECNKVSCVAEPSNNLLKETQPVKETVDVNGFLVLSSKAKSVSQIFSRHPDIASDFRPKNQQLRTAYMNILLTLIETLCRPPQELSEDDLLDANNSLVDLMDAGLKLDWLEPKLAEVSRRKKKKTEGTCSSQLQGLKEELQKLMLMVSHLGAQLEKEKAKISATETPLSFDDVV